MTDTRSESEEDMLTSHMPSFANILDSEQMRRRQREQNREQNRLDIAASRLLQTRLNHSERNRFIPEAVRDVLAGHDPLAHSRHRAYLSQLQRQGGNNDRHQPQSANSPASRLHTTSHPYGPHSPPSAAEFAAAEAALETLRRTYSSPRASNETVPDVPSDVPTSSEAAAYFASGSEASLLASRLDSLRQRHQSSFEQSNTAATGPRPTSPAALSIDPYNIAGLERSSNPESPDDVTRTSLSVPRPSIFNMLNPPVRRPARPSMAQGLWAPHSSSGYAPPNRYRTEPTDPTVSFELS